ncbi:MAG: carboxypeptidase-like regulatory domain-containing protein [Bacteroidota bacterium]
MRNIYTLSLLLFFSFQLGIAQYNYDKNWKKVEKLEVNGKPAAAFKIVKRIYKNANKEQNTAQIVKSMMYSAKFSLLITEDSEVVVLQNLQSEIAKQSFPTTAILENVYAEFLSQYFKKYQYKIRQRTTVASDTIPADFRLWDTKTFVNEIHKSFQHSIQQETALQQLPVEEYMALVRGKVNTQKYNFSLYDLLVYNMLDFYKKDIPYDYKKQDKYKYGERDFAPTDTFMQRKFDSNQPENISRTNILQLFQKLEAAHQNNSEAYVDVVLQRLNFVRYKVDQQKRYTWYTEALEKLIAQYQNDPVEALIQYELAAFYFDISNPYSGRSLKDFSQLRIKAVDIMEKMIAKYPNSEGSIKCELLAKKITQKDISFKTEAYTVPNKPLLAQTTFKNIDTLFVKAYRVSHSFLEKVHYNKRDSVVGDFIKRKKEFIAKDYPLTITKDYYEHTTEISIPPLPKGRYLLTISNTATQVSEKDVLAYDITQKTNLSELITNFDTERMHTIVNRATGKPIHKATIKVFDSQKYIDQIARTDAYGNARIRKREGNRSVEKLILHDEDTLYTRRTSLGYNRVKDDEDRTWNARPFVFTDRSIYRPGQTVYFKGILVQERNDISAVVPNTYCKVVIESDYDDIKTLRLKTNEFGSFSGKVKLPKNIQTGEFTITIDEDDAYEGDDPFWDEVYNFDEGTARFLVEEYKRPRFEVLMNPLTKNISFNDSVTVTGKARALLGSAISDAKVKYTITREASLEYNSADVYDEEEDEKIIAEAITTTDAYGNFEIPFVTIRNEEIPLEDIYSYSYNIEIEVIDINGETQTAEKTVYVKRQRFHLYMINPFEKERSQPFKMTIEARDANNVPFHTNGFIKVYKLKSPERIFRKRPWRFPEMQLMSKAIFIQQFPHISYDEEEKARNQEKGAQVAEVAFDTETNAKHTLNTSTWETGEYTIESYAYDEKIQDTVYVSRNFTLTDVNDTYLADNKLFEYTTLNDDYKKDGFVKLKLSTALRDDDLNVFIHVYYKEQLLRTQLATIQEGSKVVKVPIDASLTDEITIRMSFIKFNTYYDKQFVFNLYEQNRQLTIETTTFRNKLEPGQKETWRFKITDIEKNGSMAEVLASMYDESLDQFNSHVWEPNFNYFSDYYRTPRTQSNYFETTKSLKFHTLNSFFRIPSFKNYIQFNWFGVSFHNVSNSNYRYLKNLKEKRKNQRKPFFSGTITGHVLDETGMPLPGATIAVKGSTRGTTSDFDGLFTINTDASDTLVFSYIGYKTQEINANGKNNINVLLEQGDELDEVVIVAYGGEVQSAKVAYSIATVEYQSVSDIPIASLEQVLQGAAAGVNVSTASGAAGDDGVIVIRGRSSLEGDVEPLFVIDGVPVDANAFKNLNQTNIVSFVVLKDASAKAIYGSRGAGGVIIISTKYGTTTETIDGMEVIVGITEDDLGTVETRKELKETAFFYPHLRTDAEGNVAVEFEAPESLTRWKFQLFAHQKDGMYGSIAKNAMTQKELMVVPNMPRFLREKDTIVISSKIVNLIGKETKGIASLQLLDAYTMESIDTKVHLGDKYKSFTVPSKGNTNLSWKLYIPKGYDAIQYKVVAKANNFTDGEESALPVLKNSILVTEAKPIWVKPGEEKEVTFSKLANDTSTSLEQHQLTLEYTSNPTWSAIQSLPYLMEYTYECAEQTFARLYANMLAAHILQSAPKVKEVFEAWKANGALISDLEKNPELKTLLISETPWARDAASETEKKQQLSTLFDPEAIKDMQQEMVIKLENLQKESGGFPWFAGGNENPYITLHLLQTYAHLVKLKVITDKNAGNLQDIMDDAYDYMDERFLIAYDQLLKTPNDEAYKNQIDYIYTRTMIPDAIEIPKNVKKAIDFYLETLQKDWILLSIKQKAMVALSLARMGKRKEAKKIMESLEESAVKSSESGMYWKALTARRYFSSNAVEVQALLIEAFAEITNDTKIVQELQLWLLQQKQYNRWATTKATTKAIYALLLNPQQFVSIKDNTKFTIGTEKISSKKLDETQKEAGTGYFKTSWKKDDITKDKATIRIQNNGKTTGYGAVYWQYFEALDKITKSENVPLQVSKALYLKEKNNNKETLVPIAEEELKIGDVITVRLIIENTKEVEFIHLKDMRAAGLEPINVLSEYKWQDGIGYYESTRDASTNFFFDRIPEGVFILEYELRVNNIGAFSNGITTIESMYAPELRSHTESVRIKVE